MDAKFHPAMSAIKSGDLDKLRALLLQDPSLATARSSSSHPTLLQCLALMVEADVVGLREAGFSDEAILDINQVASYYAFVNRLADGLGVELEKFWESEKR